MPVKINPIPYTQDELKEMFDYKDGELFWKKRKSGNNYSYISKKAGTLSHDGYIHLGIKRKYYLIHRIIWKYVYGEDPKQYIDHINGIRTDCRIENLRDVSWTDNRKNIPKFRNGGLEGCCYSNEGYRIKKWIPYINNPEGKRIYLKRCMTELEAFNSRTTYLKEHPEIS